MTSAERLVREHHALVYSAALRVLGDPAAAEDVAQDVFLKVLERPGILDDAENLRAFLARSAINRALDLVRERDRRERREQATVPQPREADPVESAWWSELRERVDELPEEERRAIDLRFYRGLTVREAAQSLNVSTGTVCNRLAAALSHLKKLIGAAAFGALASVCLGGEAPPGVEERLVSKLAPRRRWTRRAAGAAAIAAAILFAVWVAQPEPEAPKSWTVRGEMAARLAPDAGATESSTPAGAASADPHRTPNASSFSVPPGPILEEQGFLYSDAQGQALSDPCWVEGISVQTLRRLEGEALRSLPSNPATSFLPFLRRAAPVSAAPLAHVRLAGRRGPDGLLVSEVLEVEVLGEPWLYAWRDMMDAVRGIRVAFQTTPGPARRQEIGFRTWDFCMALDRAKAARKGEAVHAWRQAREFQAVLEAYGGLLVTGCADQLGPAERTILQIREMRDLQELQAGPSEQATPDPNGLRIEDVGEEECHWLGLTGALVVRELDPESLLARAGLQVGDVVWSVGTPESWFRPDCGSALLAKSIGRLDSGMPTRLRVLRGSATIEIGFQP